MKSFNNRAETMQALVQKDISRDSNKIELKTVLEIYALISLLYCSIVIFERFFKINANRIIIAQKDFKIYR